MNRQQKREYERKVNKLTNWLNTLSPEQEKAISMVIDERVAKTTYSIRQALDTSVAAAMTMKTDLNITQIEDILSLASEYMADSKQFLSKYGSDWIMKINEIKPKIKEECIKLLEGNKSQADAIKILGEKFKDVPQKDRVNIFKETKEEWMKPKEIENKPKSEEKEASRITHDKENKSNTERIDNPTNTFEVIEKKVTLKGKYGTYKKDNTGVLAGEIKFANEEELRAYQEKELAEYQRQINEFNNHVEEIKAVFSYV